MHEDNLQSPISNLPDCKQKAPLVFSETKGASAVPLCLMICFCGPKGARTLDLYNAIVALSQLSYGPMSISQLTTFYFNPVAHFVQKYSIAKTIHSGA
jgi:hypothetical protein